MGHNINRTTNKPYTEKVKVLQSVIKSVLPGKINKYIRMKHTPLAGWKAKLYTPQQQKKIYVKNMEKIHSI